MLTTAQLQALKADIAANTNTIPAGKPWTNAYAGVQVKNVPGGGGGGDDTLAGWYNQFASPDFKAWSTGVSRSTIYNTTGYAGSVWDWTVYKNQSVGEQNAWVQMFMGDQASFAQLNVRVGVGKIFTGSAQANAQRDHCFAVATRLCRYIEKLFATAVANPPANSGNTAADALGSNTNPAVMGFEGLINANDIDLARNS